jgi:uncharacterized membrane protein
MTEHVHKQLPRTSARVIRPTNWHESRKESLSSGERAADILRNSMGSWTFVFAFLAFMAVWALANTVVRAWDPYPFILLNLFLSMLAGLQGAILLIAAKRQDAVAAALAEHDYETNVAAKKDVETLLDLTGRQLVMLHELRDRIDALERGSGAKPPGPLGS